MSESINNGFENVFVKTSRKFSRESVAKCLNEGDPLDGIEPTAALYWKLDLVVFAEPAVIPQSHRVNSDTTCDSQVLPDVTLVKLERDFLNPDAVVEISDDDGSIAVDDEAVEHDDTDDDKTEEVSYKCDDDACEGRIFQTLTRLKQHIRRMHDSDKRRYQCWNCDKSFPVQYLLTRHQFVHERKKRQCPVCLKMLSLRSSLSLHMRSHTGEKRFTCLECGKTFTRQSGLLAHSRFVHADESSLNCPHCDTRFVRRALLAAHLRDVHVSKRTLECELCGKCFSNTAALGAHRAKRHESHQGGEAKFLPNNPVLKRKSRAPLQMVVVDLPSNQPQDLSKTASGAMSRNRNTILTSVSKQFPIDDILSEFAKTVPQIPSPERCLQCGIIVPTRWFLIQHLRTHFPNNDSPKQDFWCQICEETIEGRSKTVEHFERWHSALNSAEKKHKCGTCQKTFRRNEHLSRHLLTHTGEKPYQCHACHKRFKRKAKLSEHLKKEHGCSLPSNREMESRPRKLVIVEMEQGLADGSKEAILNEGKVVGFKTVRPKMKLVASENSLENVDGPDYALHPKFAKRKKKKSPKRTKLKTSNEDI